MTYLQKGQPAMQRLRFMMVLFSILLLALSAGLIFAQTDEPSEEPEAGPTETPVDAPTESAAVSTAEAEQPTAEPTEEAPLEYIGSRRCFSCHRGVGQPHFSSQHALTFQEADEDVIVADFSQGEDVRTVQLPGEDTPRAFTADDVSFVVGTGTYAQQFVVAEEGDETTRYWVLPALWNAGTQSWQAWGPDGAEWPGNAFDWTQNCAGCHTTGLNSETSEWIDVGVQCEACHGPGSAHFAAVQEFGSTDDPEEVAQIRDAIVLSPDPQICGQCHSQGVSGDGHPYPTQYLPGDDLLANGVFELVSPDDDAYWWTTGHASQKYMQFNEWLNSGHPHALQVMRANNRAVDACLACHSANAGFVQTLNAAVESGNLSTAPDPALIDTAQFGVTCTSCHVIHPATTGEEGEDAEPDAAAMAAAVYDQCTACHSNTTLTGGIHHPTKEMFEGAQIVDEVDGMASSHFTQAEGPKCATCHMPRVPVEDMGTRASHSMNIVAPGDALDVEALQDTCSACHSEQADPAALQELIDTIQRSTQGRINAARDAVTDSTPDWVVQALDFVDGDGSQGIHNYEYSDRLLDAVEQELGLAVVPTLEVTAPPEEPAQPTPTLAVVEPDSEAGETPEASSGN